MVKELGNFSLAFNLLLGQDKSHYSVNHTFTLKKFVSSFYVPVLINGVGGFSGFLFKKDLRAAV